METITKTTLTCPQCGQDQTADMPTDACQFFYECVTCKAVLRPKEETAVSFALTPPTSAR